MKVVHIGKALPKSWQPKVLPREIGPITDLLIRAKRARRKQEEKAESLKEKETEIEEHLIRALVEQGVTGARGRLGSVALVRKESPRITDYEAFCRYVQKEQAWDLFTKRAHETASQARWDAGEEIPGVERHAKMRVSVSEVK